MTRAPGRARRPQVHRGVELHCGMRFEDEARAEGHVAIAGVDEVGRGALCGPVVAGAVVGGLLFTLLDQDIITILTYIVIVFQCKAGACGCCYFLDILLMYTITVVIA